MFASPDAGGVRWAGASTAVVNGGERKRRSRFRSGKKKKKIALCVKSVKEIPKTGLQSRKDEINSEVLARKKKKILD